ncbi:recombinase family protein [Streptomyces roseicoloratus]|uniref:Recombinase family protein n=1 Tax=Streptomyces roseicoloratus TaxID=2508722 RepID=A0ABY9RTZ8_9ACTN|nr:recombinase family protein [Streptomyces roseicoloratus]WMX45422.1 recombinase family protein [Streptomyces roseicoloratus]
MIHTFKDVGRTGGDPIAVRPGFEDLMPAVRAGEVDVVVVSEPSRLTRQGAHDALESRNDGQRSTCCARGCHQLKAGRQFGRAV